jgi:hypothetical protein
MVQKIQLWFIVQRVDIFLTRVRDANFTASKKIEMQTVQLRWMAFANYASPKIAK